MQKKFKKMVPQISSDSSDFMSFEFEHHVLFSVEPAAAFTCRSAEKSTFKNVIIVCKYSAWTSDGTWTQLKPEGLVLLPETDRQFSNSGLHMKRLVLPFYEKMSNASASLSSRLLPLHIFSAAKLIWRPWGYGIAQSLEATVNVPGSAVIWELTWIKKRKVLFVSTWAGSGVEQQAGRRTPATRRRRELIGCYSLLLRERLLTLLSVLLLFWMLAACRGRWRGRYVDLKPINLLLMYLKSVILVLEGPHGSRSDVWSQGGNACCSQQQVSVQIYICLSNSRSAAQLALNPKLWRENTHFLKKENNNNNNNNFQRFC